MMFDFALATVAFLALVGVLHPEFSDNLLQRIGLSAACMGSTLTLLSDDACPERPVTVLTVGVAIYAIGTAKNAVKFRHHRRVRRHEQTH